MCVRLGALIYFASPFSPNMEQTARIKFGTTSTTRCPGRFHLNKGLAATNPLLHDFKIPPNSSQQHPLDLSLQTAIVSWGELSAASLRERLCAAVMIRVDLLRVFGLRRFQNMFQKRNVLLRSNALHDDSYYAKSNQIIPKQVSVSVKKKSH